MLHHHRHAFHPVSGVQVVGVFDHLVGGGVDVAADDAVAAFPLRQLLQLLLVAAHKADHVFDLHLHPAAEGEALLVAPAQPGVVGAVQAQQQLVAHGAHLGQPDVVGRHVVKAVSMHHEVAAMRGFVDVLVHQGEARELEGEELFQDVVVVAAQVDHFRSFLFHFLEHGAHKVRVLLRPAAGALECPHVDDVAVEHELLALAVADEMRRLHCLGVGHAEVDIGHEQSLDAEFGLHEECRPGGL